MQASLPDTRGAPDAEDHPGAVAAHCFRLAEQIGGGPVRDALVAMGQDYSTRARAAVQTAASRIELEDRSRDSARFWPLRLFAELLAPLPPRPARCAAPAAHPAAPAQRATQPPARTAPTAAPSTPGKRSRPASRLFRMHALARIES